MEKIKWIFFDIGCTLLDESIAMDIRLKKELELEEVKARGFTYDSLYQEIIKASKNYQEQFKGAMKNLSLPIIPYEPEYEVLYDDTISSLEVLYKSYNLGIIANQVKGLKDRLEQRDLAKYFKVIIGSNDVGLHKPDLEIFRLALKEANSSANECLMVGDRLDNDIYPAKKLGMKTMWIKQGLGKYQEPLNKEYVPDYEVNTLSEINKCIK